MITSDDWEGGFYKMDKLCICGGVACPKILRAQIFLKKGDG